MKIVTLFIFIYPFCFAESYRITQVIGTYETEYTISLGKIAKINSIRDGQQKVGELSPQNSCFIEKQLKTIERMPSHENRFCPRNYFQIKVQNKSKPIIACGNSSTKISTGIRQLIRVIDVYIAN